MTKLPQEAKEYIESNIGTSNRTLATEILKEFNLKTTHTTVGKEKKEIMERNLEKIEPKMVTSDTIIIKPPKSKKYLTENDLDNYMAELKKTAGISEYLVENGKIDEPEYFPITKGTLEDMIRDTIKGEIDIDSELLERLKKGYPKEPFGGDRIGSGGWNSITYAVFNVLIASKCVYIKKE